MAEIGENLSTIYSHKRNIKNAIITKGQTVGNDISTYASAILNISKIYTDLDMDKFKFVSSTFSTIPDWINNGNWSNVTDTSYCFSNCDNLKSFNMTGLSNAVNVEYMFKGCASLTYVDMSKCVRMNTGRDLFSNCTVLASVKLPSLVNVTTTRGMFYNCYALTQVNLTGLQNADNVTDMFYNCSSIKTISINGLSNASSHSLIYNCTQLTNIQFQGLTNVTSFAGWYSGISKLSTVAYKDCHNLTNLDFYHLGLHDSIDNRLWAGFGAIYIFRNNGITSLAGSFVDKGWQTVSVLWSFSDLPNLKTMNGCFSSLRDGSPRTIQLRDLSALTNIAYMCYLNTSWLTSVTISNVPKLSNISNAFAYASYLSKVTIDSLSKVTASGFSNAFQTCTRLKDLVIGTLPNVNITNWGMGGNTALTVTSLMNIINALPTTTSSRTCTLGTTNLNKLTAAQKAIATNKGWTLN